MAVLHIVCRPDVAGHVESPVLARLGAADGMLLLRDAVYSALAESSSAHDLADARGRGIALYCLLPDLALRGIKPEHLCPGIQVIDYAGFVDLSIQYPRNCSW